MAKNIELVNADEFRAAMRRWATGVTIVTAQYGTVRHGMTVSSFTSISLEPPLVVVSLEHTASTTQLIQSSGAFGVSILADDQQVISDRFAGRIVEVSDKFAGLEWTGLITGAPLLVDALAGFDCRVMSSHTVGTHILFIGEVLALRSSSNSNPLIYFERDYHQVVK